MYMAEIVKETVTTQKDNTDTVKVAPVKMEATAAQTVDIWFISFWGSGNSLAFRFVLKLTGASWGNAFVGLVYALPEFLFYLFRGYSTAAYTRNRNESVFESSTLIAIIVYAVVAWGIVKLLSVLSGEKQQTD